MRSRWLMLLLTILLFATPADVLAQSSEGAEEESEEPGEPGEDEAAPAAEGESPEGEAETSEITEGEGEITEGGGEAIEGEGEAVEGEGDSAEAEGETGETTEDEAAPDPAETAEAMPLPSPLQVPDGLAQVTARVTCAGRVGAGLLVDDGRAVITLLEVAQLGYLADVRLGDGHLTRARIVAVDTVEKLALLELDEPAPEVATPLRRELPALGEQVSFLGHGGATGLSDLYQVERELLTFSLVHAHVASAPVVLDDLAPAEQPRWFLVDRSPGEGDGGSPVFDANGYVVGLLIGEVDDGGGRSIAVGAATLDDLVAEPRLEKKWRKRHHLQSWGGVGLVAHNRPSHLAGAILYGFRLVFLDSIRLEPWIEVDLGTRAPRPAEGDLVSRPRDFWWSIETGLTVGYRIPMFVEGGRNYIIPTAGFRIGWNRFEHKVDSLVSSCSEGGTGDCGFELERSTDQERSLRPGIDLGIDVRHGKVRFGYRFFIDPMAVRPHSMHRLVVTFDGLGLPVKVGDSN
jgi:hypothetical protein